MDTKIYDMDSPYTNLTSKFDSDYQCKSYRKHANGRLLSCLYGLSVFICIASCVVSCVCAFYCLRAASTVLAVQSKLPTPVVNTADTPTAQALQDYESSGDYIDDEEITGDQLLEEDADDDTDTQYDDDYYDDDDSEDGEVEVFYDWEDSTGSPTDAPTDAEDALSDTVDAAYSGDDGYWSDDEDDDIDGSGDIGNPTQGLGRSKRETNNPDKAKKTNTAQGEKKENKKGKKKRTKGKKQPRKARLRFLPAAQFDGSVDEQTVKRYGPEYHKAGSKVCVQINELEGTQCNNGSFFPDKKNENLKILKPEAWVTKNTSPVLIKDSVMTVQSSGVHLLYAQVLFSGYEATKSASIVVAGGKGGLRRLSCNADANTNNLELDLVPEENLHTCSIFGMLNLSKGEVIELVSSNKNAAIERKAGATYFGIVQLNKDK